MQTSDLYHRKLTRLTRIASHPSKKNFILARVACHPSKKTLFYQG